MNELKEFEKRFQEEEVELLVLTKESVQGAAVFGDMLRPSLEFIASIDVKTGVLSEKKGMLQWMIKKVPERTGWGYDFRQFQIYRIKARKNIPVKSEPYMAETVNNCYMVVGVVEEGVSEPRLDKIRERFSAPVAIEDEGLGRFVLDRSLSWFEGEIEWLGHECSCSLETDEEDGDTAEKARTVLRELYKDLENWDHKFRTYAAEELTGLANDWLSDEERQLGAITKERFAERLQISELVVSPDGNLTLYYDDDDMFYGHVIEINANISGELSYAVIAG